MANFDKKWSQLSKDESKAMKKKYGSRDAWQKAKGKAQSHQSDNSSSSSSSSSSSASKPYVPVTDAKSKANTMEGVIKNKNGVIVGYTGAAAKQRNAERAENRRQANITNYGADGKGYHPETGKNQNGYTRQQQAREDRRDSAEAYRQSRLDLQAAKAKHGPRGHYGMQSALNNQSVAKVGQKYAHSGDLNEREADRNALVRTFQNSGYDYSHDEVQRSLNDGAYQVQNSWIYDQYGGGKEGWKNWRDNYSIYGGENAHNRQSYMDQGRNEGTDYTYDLGNFKGSQDLMDFDEVMDIGRKKQQAGRDFYNSQEFQDKYGKYDWAQKN